MYSPFLNRSVNISHYFVEGGVQYVEQVDYEELRTLGYFANQADDVTENQIRSQLGFRSRAAYLHRPYWERAN